MSNDPTLVQKARNVLRSGGLPARRPDRIWGGASPGTAHCRVCGELIANDQAVWEAEFVSASGSMSHFFHVLCYRALESARKGA